MTKASIIIPHYRTPDQLELCLRCIAHFTDEPHEVVVVDNGSSEEVVTALRKRDGIVLVERVQRPELGQEAHKEALDTGIAHSDGAYVVCLHSDTFVHRRGWLSFLIDRLEEEGLLAYGPASHRLYPASAWETLRRTLRRKREGRRWIRPVFTIYRRELFAERRFADFGDVGELTASLVADGRAGFLDRRSAARWAFHDGGTTKMELLKHRPHAHRRKQRRLRAFLDHAEIQRLLSS